MLPLSEAQISKSMFIVVGIGKKFKKCCGSPSPAPDREAQNGG
jgi:hypothetical protein